MKNILKKGCSLLVIFAMVFTMVIPVSLGEAFGATTQVQYTWPTKKTVTQSSLVKKSIQWGNDVPGHKQGNHYGIDIIKLNTGTPIYAAASGTVKIAAKKGGYVHKGRYGFSSYGKLVVIEHDNKEVTLYGHNSEVLVNVGEKVKRGQQIAKAGNTGFSNGTHLHFGIYKSFNHLLMEPKGVNVPPEDASTISKDPMKYLKTKICNNHVYSAKTGLCNGCGDAYYDTEGVNTLTCTSYADKRFYRVSTKTDLKVFPADEAKVLNTLSKGRHIRVIGSVGDGGWYKVTFGTTSSGKGFIKASAIEMYTPDKDSSTIKINDAKDAYTVKHGSNPSLAATVSSNYPIKTIKATIGSKKFTTKEFKEFYLSKGLLIKSNTKLDFSKLSVGTHNYTFTATDISGASVTKTGTVTVYSNEVAKPTFKVEDTSTGKKVTITNSAGGTLYYAKDGEDYKTGTTTAIFNLTESGTTSFRAYVKKSANASSAVETKTITVEKLSIPEINIDQVGKTGKLTITPHNGKDTIMYKVGTSAYKKYDGSVITVDDNTTISAYATRTGYAKSEVVTETTDFSEPNKPEVTISNADSKVAVGESVTVNWKADKKADSYTVTLHSTLGSLVIAEKVTDGTTATFPLEKEGRYFVSVVAENELGSSEEGKSDTITAVAPLTVTFKSSEDDDAEVLTQVKVNYGETAEPIPVPAKRGYTFDGWMNSQTGVVSLNAYTKTPVKEDIEYIATYSQNNYEVKIYDTDGSLIETQSVKYGESARVDGLSVTLKPGYVLAGWYVTQTSNGDSNADYTKVDCNMEIKAVAAWADKELPVLTEIISAEQSTDGKYINAKVKVVNGASEDLSIYLVGALKAKDSVTGVEKTTYADRKIVYLDIDSEETVTMKMKADAKGISSLEVVALECNENLSTGSAYSETAKAPITLSKNWGEWSAWTESKPSTSEDRDIEEKTEYRYSDKIFAYSGYDTLSGYTKDSTQTLSTEYGNWSSSKPSASTTTTSANKTMVSVDSTSAYRWVSYYCDCKKVCWKSMSGSCGYCGGATDNTLVVYTKTIPSNKDSDGSYHFAQKLTASASGSIRAIYWKGNSVSSITTNASTDLTYLWKSSTFEKTIYRTKTVKTRNTFSKWGEWSEWSDAAYASTSNRKVENRTVYRYRDLELETSGSFELDPEGKLTRNVNGRIDVSEDLNGKVATIMVYQANNTDPNKYQLQYLGQTEIGEQNSYDFSFIPKEEPTTESGNYIVSLGVQGTTGLVTVGMVEAPVKEHSVVLYYTNVQGNRVPIGETQVVKHHGDADIDVNVPEIQGYYFVGWSQKTTDITSDCEIEAMYVPLQNSVVFVDWVNESISMSKALSGTQIELPGSVADTEGYHFIGWKLEDGTVIDPAETTSLTINGDMIITAEYEQIGYEVRFLDESGNVIDSQTVKYGEFAEPPAYEPSNGTFVGWDTQYNWWNVKSNVDVYPNIIYQDTAATVEGNVLLGDDDKLSLELATESENAEIYYTVDGTVPTAGMIAEFNNTDAESYGGSIIKYSAPIEYGVFDSISAVAFESGKNESEVLTEYIAEEPHYIDEEPLSEWSEVATCEVKAEAGKDVNVEISVSKEEALVGYDFLISCDNNIFYADGNEYDEPICTEGQASSNGVIMTSQDSTGFRVTWVSDEANKESGSLFNMTLHTEENIESGVYPITICYAPQNTLDANYDMADMTAVAVDIESEASVDINSCTISLARDTYVYEGNPIEPAVNIENLKEGEDYTVTYENNTNVGTAKAVIKGIGGYEGSVTKEFTITAANIANTTVDSIEDVVYTGSEITPDPIVRYNGIQLEKGKDYNVTYASNTNVGQAEIIISGIGNFNGVNKVYFNITKDSETLLSECLAEIAKLKEELDRLRAELKEANRIDIIRAEVSAVGDKVYTGKDITPGIVVKYNGRTLVKDTDYVVKYANNKLPGIAEITVTGIGNYKESIVKQFNILPKEPANSSVALYGYNDVKVSWTKSTGVTGYNVYYKVASKSSYSLLGTTTNTYYKKANLSDGVKYNFKVVPYYQAGNKKLESPESKVLSVYTLKKISGVKAKKSSSKVKVSWTNISGERGYQISQSTSKSKTKIVATYSTTSGKSKTVKATKGKTYYYKVRAYTIVNGEKIYGPWSSVVKYKRK